MEARNTQAGSHIILGTPDAQDGQGNTASDLEVTPVWRGFRRVAEAVEVISAGRQAHPDPEDMQVIFFFN